MHTFIKRKDESSFSGLKKWSAQARNAAKAAEENEIEEGVSSYRR